MNTLIKARIRIVLKSPRWKILFALSSFFLAAVPPAWTQSANETLLSDQTAYNPIPSPDGKMIAYVRTGWGRLQSVSMLGRAELISEVNVMTADGNPLTPHSLGDAFLAGWTSDGKALICYRDWSYRLVTLSGDSRLQGRLPGPDDMRKLAMSTPWTFKALWPTERVFYLPSLGIFGWSEPDANLENDTGSATLIETQKGLIARHAGWLGEAIVPSPDGRYLAIFNPTFQQDLWVYDTLRFGSNDRLSRSGLGLHGTRVEPLVPRQFASGLRFGLPFGDQRARWRRKTSDPDRRSGRASCAIARRQIRCLCDLRGSTDEGASGPEVLGWNRDLDLTSRRDDEAHCGYEQKLRYHIRPKMVGQQRCGI
jgi:hypothetical protein